ncbi:uncharacterized protein zgc:171497 [Danio rerio]|uniref:Uncharacterized protein zgc:171497 n=1 Tax=Danio rerio TaxID=7955 RepID=A9JST8_DANRE|nr:uncharacterized protein zgc:171497 isoform X2 [Danio rerio]AAI55071.1 Zgc:171497 protein [Danio rerio]|eukprot:XP_009302712.1 uncharacterized protein zgc:171497 isoform X2 [Danio rerio]
MTLKVTMKMLTLTAFAYVLSGVSGPVIESVFVKEGDAVTLNTNHELSQQDRVKWYFNDVLITQIQGDVSQICTDVQCYESNEKFRDRLILNHQTGSLTIMNTRNTDAGNYRLMINNRDKIFNLVITSRDSGVDTDMSVTEGDAVTLHTDVKIKQQDRVKFFYNRIRIAQISGDFICTDVQCNKGTEGFTNRLMLDNQTGSLTIMNINTADSGEYKLEFLRGSSSSEKNFNITVIGVSDAEREEKKSVMEGTSVTLNASVIKNPHDVITWTFNDILIADISGDQSQICTDVQCKERFTDRLELDQQTGSLIITNTRSTDAGVYKLQIIRSRSKVRRRRSISVTSIWSFNVSVIDSGLSAGALSGILVAAFFLLVAAVFTITVIFKTCKTQAQNDNGL